MQLDDALDQRQAEAGAGAPRLGPARALELLEDALVVFRRDADAGVGDGEQRGLVLDPAGDGDGAARRRELDGVGDQVAQRLLEPALVDLDRAQIGRAVDVELQVLRARPLGHDARHGVEQRLRLHRLAVERHAAGLDRGEVEDVVDDGQQALATSR